MKRQPLTFDEASRGVIPDPFTREEWEKINKASAAYAEWLIMRAVYAPVEQRVHRRQWGGLTVIPGTSGGPVTIHDGQIPIVTR